MHRIYIRDLHISATHGVYTFEKESAQEFIVSVSVEVEDWSHNDHLTETLNYELIREEIISVLSSSHKNLLETLVEEIAEQILKRPRAISCEVVLEKTNIFPDCIAGVSFVKKK